MDSGSGEDGDEVRFIPGEIGKSIVLAGCKGRDWRVGAMTKEARRVSLIETMRGHEADAPSLELKSSGGADIGFSRR